MALILTYSPGFENQDFLNKLKSQASFTDDFEIEIRKKKYGLEDGKNDKFQGKLSDDEPRTDYDANDPMHSELNRWRLAVETCTRTYSLVQGQQVGGQIQIQIPRAVDFEIEIFTRLLISSSLSQENKDWLQSIYDGFSGTEEDLFQYLGTHDQERKNKGISMDDFDIVSYGKIKKLDEREVLDQYLWYQDFLSNSEVQLVEESRQCSSQLSDPYEDPLREGEVVNDIHEALKMTPEKKVCGIEFDIKPEKVVTLLAYPEFKIVWVKKVIKIGCVKITIPWPKLMIRLRKKVLYFSASYAPYFGSYMKNVVLSCLKSSAGYGLVVALASQNITAGLAVFRALFERCIYSKIFQVLECFFPELFLQTEKTPWKPV